MNYWLFKTEPDVFGIEHLRKDKVAPWDGVRNYTARNFLRDDVKVGDEVLIYHSSCKITGIAGIATVTKAGYPDPAQFNPESDYYDPKATQDTPRWFCVDVAFKEQFSAVLPLKTIKTTEALSEMVLLKQSRLSVSPVTKSEFQTILKLITR